MNDENPADFLQSVETVDALRWLPQGRRELVRIEVDKNSIVKLIGVNCM